MATKDYNTNTAVPGLKGLQLYEGDADYEKKKLYKESGITWQDLMQNDPETAYKWASEQLSRSPFRLPNKPVTDDEVATYLNDVSTSSPDMSSVRTMQDLLNESVRVSDKAVVDKLANAQQIADETGYGNSKYDTENEVSLDEMQYLKDIRAAEQSNFAKIGVSGLKAATLAGTTFLDGTVGFIYGVGSAVANGDVNKVNANAVSDALQGINNWMEEVAPMYTSEYYDSKPWYQKLNTVELWSDSVLKNMGFTVGALWSGSTATKLLRSIPKVAQSMKAQEILGSMYSAVSEGRIEANQTYHDLLDSTTGQINSAFERYLESIKDDEDYEQKANIALEQREQLLQEAEHNAASAGIQTALANTVLLSLTNYSTWGRMFSKDFNANKQLMFDGLRYNVDKQSFKGVLGNVGKDMFVEGNEEMLQQVASTWSKLSNSIEDPDYYNKAFMDVETKNDTYESLDALGTAFLNTYGNPNEWEQFFAGAATSLIGFGNIGRGNNSNNESVFKGSPVSWQGGILGKYLAMKRDNAEMEQQASALNAAIDKIQSQGNYFTRQAQLLNDMEGYIQNDDRFSYENAQDGLDFNTFSVFQRTGRLDDLKTIIGKDFENMSDSDLEELAKDFNKRTNDGSLVTDTPKGKENFRQELIANQEKMFDRLDKFEKSFSAIKSILPQLDDSQATELAWYHWKQDIFNDRFNDVYDRNKDNIDNLATTVDALINRNEHQFREAISPNIKKQTKVLKALQPFLSSLKDANHISKVFAQGKLTTEGLEYMLNNRSIRNNSGMDAVTYKKTIDAINDINKMSTSVKSYNAKLQDYLEHPEKMNQMKEKEAQKKADKEETINRVKNEGNLLTKTPNQIAEEDINGKFSISDALNDPKITKEIKDHLNKAQELKNELLKKLNQVKEKQNDGTLSKEEAEAALNLIRRTANVAETPEGLSDPALLKAVNEESGINIDGIDELIAKIGNNEKPVSESVGTSLDDVISNIADNETSEESPDSGRDGQPKLLPVNDRDEEFERFLNEGSDTPVRESTSNLKAYTNWIYNIAWVQENSTTKSVLGALPSNLDVDAATLGAVANEAIYLRDTVKELYADALDTVNKIAVTYGSKKELMDRLYKLATEVKPIVTGGITDENVIISKLSKPSYTAFNTESDASKNPLNKFIEALVSYYSDNQGNTNEAVAESQEDVEKQQLVEKQQQAVNSEEKQKETVSEDDQPSYTKKENDKHTYWRPNVPLLPFGSIFKKDPRNYTPFWQRLSSLFKDEKLIKRSSAIGSYLQEHGTYDRIDSGKIPKTVYFKVDAALNRNADDFVVLMVNEDNEVVGDLPALGDNAVNNSIGLKEFVEEIQRQYEEAGSPEKWNAPKYLKTEVNEVLLGKAPYSNTEVNSAAEIFGDKDITFQVNPITKLPYIEVDFFGKTLQFTFITPYLNESMRNKAIGSFITDRLRKALLAKNNDERIKNVRQINGLMNNDITVYGNNDGSIDVKIISEDGTTTPILKNAVITNDNMVSALDSIWNSLYGSQVIIRPGEFKSSFADGVYLNLPKNMRLMSTWFTVKPITVNGDIIEAGKVTNKNLYTASTNKREGGNIIIETAGGVIKVDPENWIATNDKDEILPSNNNTVKQALAKAVVVHNGWDLNTSHTTMFGDYIPDGYKATQEEKEVTSNTTNSVVPPKVATQPVVQPSVNNRTEGKYKNFAEFIGKHPEYKNNPNVYNYFNRYNTDGKSLEDIDKAISDELNKAEEDDPLFRKDENQNKSQVTNAEKSWLKEALPQFSDEDRLKIVERLQYKGVKAWGMFKNGVITLASNASSGTLYHEAFHAVTHCLLSQDEKFDMFSEASNKYGKQYSKRDLEELLAEDFRRYMQFSETPVIGKIARLFRWLKHIVKTLAGNESTINKLMYDIASGKLKNRSIQSDSSTMFSSETNNEENDIYFRFIDFTSMQGLQEHIDRTFNVGRRTKESVLNSWGKTADVWRACGINVRAKWVKKPNQEGRLVLTKLETYPVNNYLTERRESYDNLYDDELEILAYRGINREEYNNLPACAKELIWKCAKLGF